MAAPELAVPSRGADRLTADRDIRRTIRTGRRAAIGRVVLYVVPADQATRAAFVSGRRVGNAVARNRARRLMREAWRALVPEIPGGFDIVFVARMDVESAGMHDVLADMRGALVRVGALAS
jgi:ribonuclease P protein component